MKKPHDLLAINIVIDALLSRTHNRISRLREFYDEGVRHFDIGLDDLKEQTDPLTSEEWDEFRDFYVEQRYDFEELMELKRHFSIVGLFTVCEMFLRRMLLLLHHPVDAAARGRILWISVGKMEKKFSDLGVETTKPDWQAIMELKEVRDCIVHSDGRADKQRKKRLELYEIPVGQSKMVLSDGYFGKSAGLIESACKRIARDCHNILKEKHVKA